MVDGNCIFIFSKRVLKKRNRKLKRFLGLFCCGKLLNGVGVGERANGLLLYRRDRGLWGWKGVAHMCSFWRR